MKDSVIAFYENQRSLQVENSYYEFPMVTLRGDLLWVGQSVKMFYHPSSRELQKVSAVARDVTKRVVAENHLRAREERFRQLAEKSPMGIFQTDAAGAVVYMNERWCEIAGMGVDRALGFGWADIIHAEDKAWVVERWTNTVQNQLDFAAELRMNNPAGLRWISARATPLRNGNGSVTGYIGTINDITEAKVAESKLAESENRYRLLSENTSDVISLHDLNGTFLFVTKSMRHLHGYEPEEVIGRSASDFMHPDDFAGFNVEQFLQALQRNEPLPPIQFRIVTKKGDIVWGENIIKPVFANGVLTGFQSAVRNITLRREAEEALRKAKEQAEEATRAKSQFLSMMSHEIRTPMNAIIGLTNLLLQESPRPDQAERLTLLKFSGENLLAIINDILDFSKIEAGKILLEEIDFDFKQVAGNIINMLQPRAQEKGIQLQLAYDDNALRHLIGDPVRLRS